ncbi:PREDICTED: E3 SUMO-protein ligase NSE2-like [Amphimedon queenslandica]|uniref:E3 SUMO-protein ligase NSE2 n=1 Tax=Amphimedon queenslandica TaxID=400682 RepID=A0A1X7VD88_AMPQE|nr:PREDICTED: E3 SUMO-protein ligase NSE2-like [Amphimedon queenslandica]|eukprot:XP_011402477.2 PREDICTED: E3 SUMO-protein ligase NSE2-like [Amphimedon queenslandica]
MASTSTASSSRLGRDIELRESASDCRFFDEIIKKSFKCYSDAAEDFMEIKENYGIDSIEDKLDTIEEYLGNIAAVQYEMDNIKKVIGEGDNILQEYSESEENSESVIDIFDRHLENFKSQDTRNVNTHPAVIEYKRITEKEIEGERGALEGDEDLMMGQVQRSLTCPITLKDLEKPVKNTTCGHIYSKDAVLAHVRSRPAGRAKCPVGGCPEMILEHNLEADKDTERALRRQRK